MAEEKNNQGQNSSSSDITEFANEKVTKDVMAPGQEPEHNFVSPVSTGSGNTDTLIENLSPIEAREYVIAWMQEEKRLEKMIAQHDVEIGKWAARVKLAETKNLTELVSEATAKAKDLSGKKDILVGELNEIKVKTDILKNKLAGIPKNVKTVDTDFLLMNLEHLVGKTIEEMTTDTIFDKLDSQRTIEELKTKMNKKD
jgi:phage shock protein A